MKWKIFLREFLSPLNTLLSVDYLLLFGVDGVLPEIINGRCAMIGILSGFDKRNNDEEVID